MIKDRDQYRATELLIRAKHTLPLDPGVADLAPTDAALTTYDEGHLVTYWRLLDAAADGAGWEGVAGIVLHI